jgi:hypothetical protein
MTRSDLEAFYDENTDTIRIYADDSREHGDPCIEIPFDRDALVTWARALLAYTDQNGCEDDPQTLPGWFSKLEQDGAK